MPPTGRSFQFRDRVCQGSPHEIVSLSFERSFQDPLRVEAAHLHQGGHGGVADIGAGRVTNQLAQRAEPRGLPGGRLSKCVCDGGADRSAPISRELQ